MGYGHNIIERLCEQWLSKKRAGDSMPEEKQLATLKFNPYFIGHIRRPSRDAQLAATRAKGDTLLHIIDPCIDAQITALCCPSGMAIAAFAFEVGKLNEKKIKKVLPAITDIIGVLEATGQWPPFTHDDCIYAAGLVTYALENQEMKTSRLELPKDFDSFGL